MAKKSADEQFFCVMTRWFWYCLDLKMCFCVFFGFIWWFCATTGSKMYFLQAFQSWLHRVVISTEIYTCIAKIAVVAYCSRGINAFVLESDFA